jgi:hypothetical protein
MVIEYDLLVEVVTQVGVIVAENVRVASVNLVCAVCPRPSVAVTVYVPVMPSS